MKDKRDFHGELLDLSTIENVAANRLTEIRRDKAILKALMVENGEEDRPVTDHAVVRYLQRIKETDIEAIKQAIRTMVDESEPTPRGDFRVHPTGVVFVLGQEGQVVTILSAEQAMERPHRKSLLTEG